ncbi:MAG TPA: hypothetical protein VEI97_02230, partial [bacterium]|nr:hypothetical protein [bacterium]
MLIVAVAASEGWAAEPARVDEVRLRAAIVKGLEYVTEKGDVWLEEKNCNSCHHLPEMLWSQREAKRRG